MPPTSMKNMRKHRRGQSFAEYALILVLVALVAVLVLGLIGLASSRGYGVIAGSLGAKQGSDSSPNGGWYLYFEPNQPAQCGTYLTDSILYGEFHTNIDLKYLSFSTDTGFVTSGIVLDPHAGDTVAADLHDINYHVSMGTPDNTKCPHSIVVQSDPAHGGLTIVYPVELKDWS